MFRIGVTGTGSLVGQAIIKSILKSSIASEIEIIGFDYFDETVGSYWTSKNFILPDLLSEKTTIKQWLDEIIYQLQKNEIDIVFIGVDFELELFSKHKDDIEKQTGTIIIVSNHDSILIANDKYLTSQFLKKNNLNYPETSLLCDIDSEKIIYPKIVKPRIGYRSRNVSIVYNSDDIDKLNIKDKSEYVIQEYLTNDNEEYSCGTITYEGFYKSIILKRTLKDGNTFNVIHDKNYYYKTEKYLSSVNNLLKPFGPCNYQLRIDSKGKPKIFEINLRHSGTTYFRTLFGFNEIDYLINKILNEKEIGFNLSYGKAIRYFEEKRTL